MATTSIDVDRYTPEAQVLLCCARTQMDAEHAARLERLLQFELDWEHILRIVLPHDMAPLLYWHLKDYPDDVPAERLALLQAHFQANVHRALVFTRELVEITKLFGESGISTLPFKGVVLAKTIYHNISLRPACDLDLLVSRHDVISAKELLLARGYQPKYDFSPVQERLFLRHDSAYPFTLQEPQISLELHWRVIPEYFGFKPDLKSMWERRVQVPLGDTSVNTLSNEDLLIILCLHGFKHHWERVKWICDVAELTRSQQDLDWDWIMKSAERTKARRILWLGLDVARRLLGARLPDEIMPEMASDPAVSRLSAQVCTQLFNPGNIKPEGFIRQPFYFNAKENSFDKARIALAYLFAGDYIWYQLPGFLSPFYYVLRPFRLFGKGIVRLGRRLRLLW